MSRTRLPIDDVLDALVTALRGHGRAVLQAPPGAGKTTRVPPTIYEAGLCSGRILMLEPRRLAARAAAEHMAQTLGETVGATVGYRIRGESRTSSQTRIEVVTEGILTRMIQSDPELRGIGAVIFDEFHERSLNADLGLALCLEIREALRDDLLLLVMSATLDAGPVAALMGDAPVISSEGRSYPVETRWLERPTPKTQRFEVAIAALIEQAASESTGGLLAFLPGEGEIRRVERLLSNRLPPDMTLHPLYGAMDFKAQRAAIEPAREGRKLVLATSIAETSLTIESIRVVVDGGRARRARFDPGSGMAWLVTERVTRAEAEQRRGRAGRTSTGICYRLWTRGEEGGLGAFAPAEIETADLASLVLELALWGTANPAQMKLLTPPNPGGWERARALLTALGALHTDGTVTAHGRALAALPLHPRTAHMLLTAGPDAADLAALMSERDPVETRQVALSLRLEALRDPKRFHRQRGLSLREGALHRIRSEAKRLRSLVKSTSERSFGPGEMAALAYPDRIGLRRNGADPRWVLSGGKGANCDPSDPMATARLIVAVDLDGDQREARIRLATEISDADLRVLYGDRITWHNVCEWSKRERRVLTRQEERFDALTLSERNWRDAPDVDIARAAIDGIRDIGLMLSPSAERFISRTELVRGGGDSLPDMTLPALMASLENWLLPHFPPLKTAQSLRDHNYTDALRAMLSWEQMQRVDQLAPSHFETPLGNNIAIDYGVGAPSIALRLQELFGVTRHPVVGLNKTPLRITLLSPARRPVQVTTDLPGFWASSYEDVRKDMRGRYPKHPWPEDPTQADPTLRTKSRGRNTK